MQTKIKDWAILIISFIVVTGIVVWSLYKDIDFLFTKKEAKADIISIFKTSFKSSNHNYNIELRYYNEYLNDSIKATARIEYKRELRNLGTTVEIFYSKASPNFVYIKNSVLPTVSKVIFQMVPEVLIVFAVIYFIIDYFRKKNTPPDL
jgi:hypothetical protein